MIQTFLLMTATATTSLVAGLMYSYSVSVNPGLAKLSDISYIAAMKNINKSIQNPLFFARFVGSAFLLPLTFWLYQNSLHTWIIGLASLVYIFGVLGVTVIWNVPLNNNLEKFDLQSASSKEANEARNSYEKPWNFYHTIRTIASIICMLLMIVVCLNIGI